MSAAVNQRSALEVAVIRATLKALAAKGFNPKHVDDGDDVTLAETADEVLTLALNLDDCRVGFRDGNWLRLVFGNDGWDVVSDYSAGDCNPFADIVASIEPERLAIPAACELHVWAWEIPSGHGGCIKCGRHIGSGVRAEAA